jgi:hypothetical protein
MVATGRVDDAMVLCITNARAANTSHVVGPQDAAWHHSLSDALGSHTIWGKGYNRRGRTRWYYAADSQDPFAPHCRPLGSSPDRDSATGVRTRARTTARTFGWTARPAAPTQLLTELSLKGGGVRAAGVLEELALADTLRQVCR